MRPKVICHMLSSVDGRLYPPRYTPPFDGKTVEEVGGQYFAISDTFEAHALIIGRKTLQETMMPRSFADPGEPPAGKPATFVGKRGSRRCVVVLDPKGKVQYDRDNIEGDNIIAILSEQVSDRYLTQLRETGISYLFAGATGGDLDKALEVLGNEFGMTTVLLEGGGIINGTFLKAGLIDELSLMIYPGIDGLAGVSTIFEYHGEAGERPAQGQALELKSVQALADGVIWARYAFHKR
jgi:riboflavin biosynthesis pyrimidine reductase